MIIIYALPGEVWGRSKLTLAASPSVLSSRSMLVGFVEHTKAQVDYHKQSGKYYQMETRPFVGYQEVCGMPWFFKTSQATIWLCWFIIRAVCVLQGRKWKATSTPGGGKGGRIKVCAQNILCKVRSDYFHNSFWLRFGVLKEICCFSPCWHIPQGNDDKTSKGEWGEALEEMEGNKGKEPQWTQASDYAGKVVASVFFFKG